jgi:hypothetical protein
MGLIGPLIRANVGDTIKVVFRNMLRYVEPSYPAKCNVLVHPVAVDICSQPCISGTFLQGRFGGQPIGNRRARGVPF